MFLFVDLPCELVDVNVHPAKAEIRFKEPQEVFRLILRGIELAARSESLIKPVMVGEAGRGEKESCQKRQLRPSSIFKKRRATRRKKEGGEKEWKEKFKLKSRPDRPVQPGGSRGKLSRWQKTQLCPGRRRGVGFSVNI